MYTRKVELAELIMPQRRQQTASESVVWIVVPACGEAVVTMRTGEAQDAPGVRGRACGDSPTRNRRDPPRRPTSGDGGAYKPTAKWHRAERESEGLIVLLTGVTKRSPREGALLWLRLRKGVSARA